MTEYVGCGKAGDKQFWSKPPSIALVTAIPLDGNKTWLGYAGSAKLLAAVA